jgi:hypothetical protein
MNVLEISVAALVFMLLGVALCGLGFFCYFMLRMMKSLEQSAKDVVASSKESLAKAESVVSQVKEVAERNFGENSPTARAARSVAKLAENVPQIVGGMDAFSKTMNVFYRMAFDEKKVSEAVPGVAAAPAVDDSAFIPYSEEAAAQFEVERAAKSQRLDLSKEEMATMRTDAPKPQAEPKEAPTV